MRGYFRNHEAAQRGRHENEHHAHAWQFALLLKERDTAGKGQDGQAHETMIAE